MASRLIPAELGLLIDKNLL
jgi:hypothetical protein